MHIISGNYGNPTIALIQWAFEQELSEVYVVSIDTGFAAPKWDKRVKVCEAYAKQCGFEVIRLQSKPGFADLMRDRKEFPSQKFQWCAGFLKGLALNNWLDKVDAACAAVILSGKKRVDSRANKNLAEFLEESEHHAFRKLWFPLYKYSHEDFLALLKHSRLDILVGRSLECDPCVNSDLADLSRLSDAAIDRLEALENEIGRTMFAKPIRVYCIEAKKHAKVSRLKQELFDMGCGSPFGCGE